MFSSLEKSDSCFANLPSKCWYAESFCFSHTKIKYMCTATDFIHGSWLPPWVHSDKTALLFAASHSAANELLPPAGPISSGHRRGRRRQARQHAPSGRFQSVTTNPPENSQAPAPAARTVRVIVHDCRAHGSTGTGSDEGSITSALLPTNHGKRSHFCRAVGGCSPSPRRCSGAADGDAWRYCDPQSLQY